MWSAPALLVSPAQNEDIAWAQICQSYTFHKDIANLHGTGGVPVLYGKCALLLACRPPPCAWATRTQPAAHHTTTLSSWYSLPAAPTSDRHHPSTSVSARGSSKVHSVGGVP